MFLKAIIAVCVVYVIQSTSSSALMDRTYDTDEGWCPYGFTYVRSVRRCYKVLTENLDWSTAARRCQSLNDDAHLLVVRSPMEQSAVADFLSRTNDPALRGCYRNSQGYNFWTAGQRIDPNRNTAFVWRTITDRWEEDLYDMRYTNWYRGYPDNSGSVKSCVELWSGKSYAWSNDYCHARACSVCELDD